MIDITVPKEMVMYTTTFAADLTAELVGLQVIVGGIVRSALRLHPGADVTTVEIVDASGEVIVVLLAGAPPVLDDLVLVVGVVRESKPKGGTFYVEGSVAWSWSLLDPHEFDRQIRGHSPIREDTLRRADDLKAYWARNSFVIVKGQVQ